MDFYFTFTNPNNNKKKYAIISKQDISSIETESFKKYGGSDNPIVEINEVEEFIQDFIREGKPKGFNKDWKKISPK
jgi:hypothetical protein